MEFAEMLLPPASPLQTYYLVFLAGTLTVSSLSDLRRMAAQADFAEVWAAFCAFMFLSDVYLGMSAQLQIAQFIAKWALLFIFTASATSMRLLAISTMDVAAMAALLSTLGPAYILLAILMTVLVNELLRPILSRYGEAGAYPFLPTVLAVNVLLLIIKMAGGIESLLSG